jgi:hypothetical protein
LARVALSASRSVSRAAAAIQPVPGTRGAAAASRPYSAPDPSPQAVLGEPRVRTQPTGAAAWASPASGSAWLGGAPGWWLMSAPPE